MIRIRISSNSLIASTSMYSYSYNINRLRVDAYGLDSLLLVNYQMYVNMTALGVPCYHFKRDKIDD